jgi:hypothetical protein
VPIEVTYAGQRLRTDLLTLGELDALQGDAPSSPRLIAALVGRLTGTDARDVRLADVGVVDVDDDLPTEFSDGIPSDGRTADRYVVAFGRPPFCWPPSVTRAQRCRDLDLILLSMEGSN